MYVPSLGLGPLSGCFEPAQCQSMALFVAFGTTKRQGHGLGLRHRQFKAIQMSSYLLRLEIFAQCLPYMSCQTTPLVLPVPVVVSLC